MIKKIIFYVIIIIILIILIVFLVNRIYKNSIDRFEKFYDPKLDTLKERIAPVIPEIQNIVLNGSNKSFTINKREVFLCLKDKNGRYYDDNMLIYVLLHELAHVLCDEIGHTDKFKEIFRTLLKRATLGGIYDPTKQPVDNYCS